MTWEDGWPVEGAYHVEVDGTDGEAADGRLQLGEVALVGQVGQVRADDRRRGIAQLAVEDKLVQGLQEGHTESGIRLKSETIRVEPRRRPYRGQTKSYRTAYWPLSTLTWRRVWICF